MASAVEDCLHAYYPDVEVHIEHAEGLAECKKILTMAKAGKLKGCMIEGMGCPGGCMAGAGTNVPLAKAAADLKKYKKDSSRQIPAAELAEIHLD